MSEKIFIDMESMGETSPLENGQEIIQDGNPLKLAHMYSTEYRVLEGKISVILSVLI
jgi:hypothetical protein